MPLNMSISKKYLTSDNNPDKYATLEIFCTAEKITFTISDQGNGFSWQNHLAADASKMLDHYGKGIMLAKLVSFHQLHYNNQGNQVMAEILLNPLTIH